MCSCKRSIVTNIKSKPGYTSSARRRFKSYSWEEAQPRQTKWFWTWDEGVFVTTSKGVHRNFLHQISSLIYNQCSSLISASFSTNLVFLSPTCFSLSTACSRTSTTNNVPRDTFTSKSGTSPSKTIMARRFPNFMKGKPDPTLRQRQHLLGTTY